MVVHRYIGIGQEEVSLDSLYLQCFEVSRIVIDKRDNIFSCDNSILTLSNNKNEIILKGHPIRSLGASKKLLSLMSQERYSGRNGIVQSARL